jgi:DNA-binding transcriptional ArsR family regulator
MSTIIDESRAIAALGALAQETRLRVFRALIASHPEGIPAGEVAARCGVPHNTMSSHLAILSRSGLAVSERQGRTIFYRANVEGFRKLINFLVGDCCSGRPEICAPLFQPLLDACSCAPETVHGRPHL